MSLSQFINLQVVSNQDIDLRKTLISFLVNKGWGLLEIYKKEATLENIFTELTKN